jgi:hypothetical protein
MMTDNKCWHHNSEPLRRQRPWSLLILTQGRVDSRLIRNKAFQKSTFQVSPGDQTHQASHTTLSKGALPRRRAQHLFWCWRGLVDGCNVDARRIKNALTCTRVHHSTSVWCWVVPQIHELHSKPSPLGNSGASDVYAGGSGNADASFLGSLLQRCQLDVCL